MIIQLNDQLLVSKDLNDENSGIELPEVHMKETRNNEIFKMTKTRKRTANLPLKPVELQNRLENLINLTGWKNRILRTLWIFFVKFSEIFERNICTWQFFCDCQNCINYWSLFFFLMTGTLDHSAQL